MTISGMTAKQQIADAHPVPQDVSTNSSQFDAQQLSDSDISENNLFKDIPYRLVEPVLSQCEVRHLAKDEILITPNQENQFVYLLVSGGLEVSLDSPESRVTFPIGRGECIGEMSTISGGRTSAFVAASEASSLIAIPASLFWDEFIHIPGVVQNLLRTLTNRMRADHDIIRRSIEQQLRYEQMKKELEAAGKIQANILPQEIPVAAQLPAN